DILITDDALGNNTLTVVGVDADIFEIVGTELFLKAGSVLDKSVKDQYSITVEVNDASFGSAPNGQATFVLDIAETNDAPTAVSLQNVLPSIAEDADTQSALKVADIVVADDPVGINSFKVVGADAGLFETVGSELFLSAGVALDFESKARYDATLQVDDVSVGGSPDAVVNFSLTVDNVNEAPVLLNNTLTIVKGGTVVLSGQTLAATDVDNNNADLTYVVSQVSGGRFERVGETTTALTNFTQAQIDNGEIQFVHDDSDDAPSYVVSVSDGALSSVPQTVTIERFTRPGEGPTNVVPIAQGTDENRSLFFSASTGNRLAVENFGSSNDLAVKLSVDSGFLTLGDLDALSFVVGDGKDDRTLEFAGALADINSALNGLVLTPERGYTGSINLQIVSEDQGLGAAFADTDTIAVEVSPGKAPSALAIENNQLVSVVGGSGGSQLTLSLESVDSEQVNEIIVAETDAQGRIDGLAPGQDGYFAALVARSRVVFSTLTEGFNGLSIDRTLDVLGDTSLQFAVIQGGSLDQVRQGQTHRIRLASPLPDEGSVTLSGSALQAQQLSDRSLKLGFELEGQRGFDDIVLRAVLEEAIAPTGSNLQGDAADSELLDLRGIVGPVAATFEVYREAAFDNVVGFFTVENEAGQVLDGQGNLLTVGDAGYIAAAMSNRVAVNLTAQNNQMSTYTAELTGGQLLSSFIISNGSVESLLDGDAGNDPAVYFTHIGANSDRADHVRLLGDNTFGFEDLANGGDQDFNDIVVKVKL
ncbi:MAG: cadherin-like domain-containing protein, partial [Cyanobacteria bacterium J06649_5]